LIEEMANPCDKPITGMGQSEGLGALCVSGEQVLRRRRRRRR